MLIDDYRDMLSELAAANAEYLLVTFEPDAGISLFDYVDMQDDLEAIFGRRVDVVNRRAVEKSPNRFRKRSILRSARTIYAAV